MQSTLSAAAVLGVFSWPGAQDAHWVAKVLWYSSFFLSVFGLISSAPQRLLEVIPDHLDYQIKGDELDVFLDLFLESHKKGDKTQDGERFGETAHKHPNPIAENPLRSEVNAHVHWVLQTPMMLMSWSWIFFLLGYALFVLTPIINNQPWTVDHNVRRLVLNPHPLVYVLIIA